MALPFHDHRILFTDIDMPGSMDGLKLAHYVRRRWPRIRIMVTSGHVKVRDEELPSESAFFGKPYPGARITAKLREMAAGSFFSG
jgi:two-component system, response regulator PdtaR